MEKLKQTITCKAVGSLKWSALMEVVSRTAQPIIFVILARLLTPNDFGVIATAMIAISFSQMFWDAGLSKALIQTREAPEDAAHVVFWTNIVLGLLIYLLLFFSAPAIALFFNSPASSPVLQVLGIQIIIASLTSVQQALLVRDLDFRGLFWIKLFTAFIPGFFSIPLALYGYGVWALVAGSIAGQVINLYLLWKNSTWRPQLRYDTVLARSLLSFGFWVLLESFGAWLINWSDSLIVGRFLGVHDLGVYRTGWMLVAIIFGLVLNPFLPVLYPTFSRLQDDMPALKNTFHRVNRIIFALALPMGTGLLLVGPEASALLFGEKWQGLGFVLSVLGLTYSISWLVSLNAEIYRAMGKPNVNAILMYAHISYYLPCFYIAAQFGLETFTITRLAVAIVAIPIQTYFCVKILSISPFYLWQQGKPMILSTLVMAVGVSILKWGILPAMTLPHLSLSLFILCGTGCIIYLGCLWLLDRSFILHTSALFKRAAA
jgi:O-antigen/teichoic acid export membrane protein